MAMSQLRSSGWTLEEVHRLPDDRNRYELVHGTLLVTPAPSYGHQAIADVLLDILGRYVKDETLGRVHTPRSVVRIDGSETEPDLMVRPIPRTRPDDWQSAPLPTLVVEVLSNRSRRGDQVVKRDFYLEVGIPEYWIVDGDRRTFRVVRQGGDDIVVSDTFIWHPAGAAAALTVNVAAVFDEALGRRSEPEPRSAQASS